MALIDINDLYFTYEGEKSYALEKIDLAIEEGDFIVICGPSGSGKTTLLSQIKKEITPQGMRKGTILYEGIDLDRLSLEESVKKIGMVFQDPDNQIVMDSVIHEMAFSMENLGYKIKDMRKKIAEMSSFLGIENWIHKEIEELSGGQKQLLNLASVLLLRPRIILFDEPFAQLDPVAAKDLLQMIDRMNQEFSTTVVIVEHRLEEVFPLANKILLMDKGQIKYKGSPAQVSKSVWSNQDKDFIEYLPSTVKLFFYLEKDKKREIPLTIKEGKKWFKGFNIENRFEDKKPIHHENRKKGVECSSLLQCENLWFKYQKELPYVLRKLDLDVYEEELLGIVGANGSGKSTLLKMIAGVESPLRGKILYKNRPISKKNKRGYRNEIGFLAQNPMVYFIYDTVEEEIFKRAGQLGSSEEEISHWIDILQLRGVLKRHPYDISGGEKQKLALMIVLMKHPKLLLLDEPTKGLDPVSKLYFAEILYNLKKQGVTMMIVTHDIEFAAKYCDRCAMIFDGNITSQGSPLEFFSDNYFYTTAINRMIRDDIPRAVLLEDVIKL